MNARIKFQKFAAMKFIGHLDVMRYFQKAFRRAGIDNEYSKGYSPHQIMSFAAPLGVGLTSDSEYLDVSLLSCEEAELMIDRINGAMTEGFRITGFKVLNDREEHQKKITAMALVSAADYMVSLKDGFPLDEKIGTKDLFCKALSTYLNQETIVVDKKTKTKEVSVDIKPMITKVAFDEESFGLSKDRETVADSYENGIKVFLQLDTGSASNLKPELVMEEFFQSLGLEFQSVAWQVHRLEIYSRDEETGKLTSLEDLDR